MHVAAEVHVPPVPATVKPPLEPVLSSTIPLGAPLAEMLWKFRSLAPIVVFATLSAMPIVVASVLPDPVAVTVPPPVAAKAAFAPVERVTLPVRLIVAPVLLVSEMPLSTAPVPLIAPERVIVPPVRLLMLTVLPAVVLVIVPG